MNQKTPSETKCVAVPPFKRLNYHYGQLLGAHDFQTEQDYFRNKMLLQNRCLHGYGVVCGLSVEPAKPGEPDEAKYPNKCPTQVAISCGLGLDIHGHELVVRDPLLVDLWKQLTDDEKRACEGKPQTLYVLLCYQEVPIDKQAVEQTENCLASNTYTYAKYCESVCVRVTTQKPPAPGDETCETCCTPYDDDCLWLARIDNFERYKEVKPEDIHNEIRRPLSRYLPTVITGINWVHGATYTEGFAQWLISDENGLRIRFSRPVSRDTIKPGVVDVWRTTLWNTSPGNISVLPTMLDTLPAGRQQVEELRIRVPQRHNRDLSDADRVLIQVRCDFILDAKCGRAVDGNNIGGRVALINEDIKEEYRKEIQATHEPASAYSVATSGNGTYGGVFESWFNVIEK